MFQSVAQSQVNTPAEYHFACRDRDDDGCRDRARLAPGTRPLNRLFTIAARTPFSPSSQGDMFIS